MGTDVQGRLVAAVGLTLTVLPANGPSYARSARPVAASLSCSLVSVSSALSARYYRQ